ncbi:tryptophan synthase, partial [Sarracenia purpurea var. burkii]
MRVSLALSPPPAGGLDSSATFPGHETLITEVLGSKVRKSSGCNRNITGKFGRYGGKFVPETLITCLNQLESEFNFVLDDPHFQ